jgi:uncharacterized protein (TIGR00299 family) protein
MTALAFDGRTGASGDMVLGALVGAGADPDALAPVTDALDVTYEVETVTRADLAATKVTVVHADRDGEATGDGGGETHDDHTHDDHTHDHGHTHDHDHDGAEGHGPHRTYPEVLDVVAEMALPKGVAARAEAVFERLARAESAAHGTALDETTFHEVGADDAIADVVGAALLLDDLDPDRVVTTPVALGGGEATFSHGTYPVPTPAVLRVLADADFETYGGPVEAELLTPTGAALLAEFAEGVETVPPLRVTASGYGAGAMDLADRPNVLRALVGETRGRLRREGVTVLETNLDDVAPEVLGDLQESLADAGARDVSVVPLTMKKSRPGHLVKVVTAPEDAQRVARRLAAETGTLGVRETATSHRWVADRHFRTATVEVDGTAHEVTVKVATDDAGDVLDVSAEYEDAAAVARETDLPMREVARRAETAARE